ncbi:DNA phosphorothioation-dependent restriction protein DptG [Sporosarcina pasteurii]|uniref:DNA phosphorothioation-dependent restriction protein DptG n=1 Tax=Sporosarcina pasteurii TaxID=1474 RepID=A0A380C2C3_SPOPA|nr:DNA phosphorothioation-dependent restriction protein DptG [Sporosarcina pasteurii]MDS9471543.1 DNA phosphorothioation-dependent restriction protein DptG [Sporosarcina pasteurii]QBQ04841.1 DNA phosphorothioation-dependent restriction protein DptG [Sporosarcina pasteurii]SUJ10793.1 DNA phosphorothioation-dependent restriction protein DptG [Sporosarcina pasteurii]
MTSYTIQSDRVNRLMGVDLEQKKYSNGRRGRVHLLPFPTRNDRTEFENGFMPVVAGAMRKLFGEEIEIEGHATRTEDVLQSIQFREETTERRFENYLEKELQNISSGHIQDLSQLKFIPLSSEERARKGELDLAHFVHDTFLAPYAEEFIEKLNELEPQNILLNLLSTETEQPTKGVDKLYGNHLPRIVEQFREDFLLLLKHPSFCMQYIDLLFVHYTYIVITQLVLQVSRFEQFNEENWIDLYFFYQEEKAARWRDGYKWGYRRVQTEMANFFAHEHLLNIVSEVSFSDERNLLYHDIAQHLKDEEAEGQYIESVNKWMKEVYIPLREVSRNYEESSTLSGLFQEMYEQIKPNISNEINSRYPKGLDELFNKYFYKHGGSLGKLNSLNQSQVLLLVAISVGESRLELNRLWDELEIRGVYLDHKTREVFVELLDGLNYIEKKSDSGDAQYVKPIL